MESKIEIQNSYGEKLVGIKTIPDSPSPHSRAAILVHGFNWNKHESGMFDQAASLFAEVGITSYRFDFAGCGESEGNFIESCLSKNIDELKDILAFVEKDADISADKILLRGQSFGTSCIIASQIPAKCVILTGAIANPAKALSKRFGHGFNPEGLSIRKRTNGTITEVPSNFWKDLGTYKLDSLVQQITCPVLFIHGEQDDIVPLESMEHLYAHANTSKQQKIIPDANHSMLPNRSQLLDTVQDWVQTYYLPSTEK